MHQFNQRPPYVSILFLLVVGAAATATAFWLVDHRQAVPSSGPMIAVLIGLFFGSYLWAFFRYLGWRDKGRATRTSTPSQPDPALEGTVYGMMPGREYQVMRPFMDHYGNLFEQGERLRFKQRHFLPYHGGHTILFEERALYLQEDQNTEILDHFLDYFALIDE
jgi:Domain of unknown function (DUF3601)